MQDELGRALDELRQDGYEVLDDLDVGRANVSHCVVGPTGVFAIEPHDDSGGVFEEAHRVERLLKAAGVPQHVVPVVASSDSDVPAIVRACHARLHAETVDHIRHVLSLYRHNRRSA
jgi:hypothetical protein